MKECRFLLQESRSFRETQMLLVSNNSVFSSCRLCYNCLFSEVQVHFFFFFSSFDFFLCSNESVCITTGDEPGNVYGGGYEKHTACIYCTLWFGCAFPVFFFFFFFLIFFLSRESRKAVNFILRHCTVDQSCKYFTSTKKYQTNNMFCSFTTNKKKGLLFFFHVFCWFFYCSTFICLRDDLFHISLFQGKQDFLTVNKLFICFISKWI